MCVCVGLCFVCIRQWSQICVHIKCMSISVCVYVSWCRFVLFACIYGYESLSVARPWLNAHLNLHGSVPVWCVCACKTDTGVFCGFISELWTSWVHVGVGKCSVHCLPKPLYNDWDGRSCLLSLLCSFETRKMTSQKRQFVLCTLTDSKFKSHFKWKYFLFVSRRRAWTLTLLSANHLLQNPQI